MERRIYFKTALLKQKPSRHGRPIHSHVDHISQKMSGVSKKMDNNPGGQTGFASGAVELF
jgi:hypothetical protein